MKIVEACITPSGKIITREMFERIAKEDRYDVTFKGYADEAEKYLSSSSVERSNLWYVIREVYLGVMEGIDKVDKYSFHFYWTNELGDFVNGNRIVQTIFYAEELVREMIQIYPSDEYLKDLLKEWQAVQ